MKSPLVTAAEILAAFLLLNAPDVRAQTQDPASAAVLPSGADDDESCESHNRTPKKTHGAWYLVWENDTLALLSQTDEFYTQGIRLGYDFAPGKSPGWIEAQAGWLCGHEGFFNFGESSTSSNWSAGVFLGQNMFTPGNIDEPALIPDDRPYAAWLYVGERFTLRSSMPNGNTNYHAFELQVGRVGPQAQGEWVQTNFHRLIKSDPPMGWDNQLPDEWHVFANYRFTQRRNLIRSASRPVELDWMPAYEIGLGTLQDYVEPALTLRLGRGLGSPPFGNLPARIPAALNVLGVQDNDAPVRDCATGHGLFAIKECFVYARVSGRATAHNVFLDGTVWRDSHRVDRDPFYYDWAVGFRVRWSQLELNYEYVQRSREFSPVPESAAERSGKHDYGSVNVRCAQNAHWLCPAFFGLLVGLVASKDD